MTYHCRICQRKFSTQSGLTRHANTVHHGRTTLSQANEPSRYQRLDSTFSRPEHDEALWNTSIIRPNNPIPNDDVEMEEPSEDVQMQEIESIIEDDPIYRYNLRSQVQNIETEVAEPDLYGCSQLYYTEEYNTIPVGSINQEVHIVPRFDKRNQFLLNKYMF